jgi:Uma2 family endonuclease
MSGVETKRMTAEELWQLPANGMRRELVAGELREMTPAGSEHGFIQLRLAARLTAYVETHQLGATFSSDTGFVLTRDPDTVRSPDLAFVGRKRIDEMGIPPGYWPGAPDLAVEVVSPSDRYSDVEEKVQEWLAAGARLVWVVNPAGRCVTVHRSREASLLIDEQNTLDGAEVVPGFTCPVADIFPPRAATR